VTKFASCFLIVFGELALGGMFALSIPPFFKVERGFYKSSASVYLCAGLLTLGGIVLLALRGDHGGGPSVSGLWAVAAIWAVFCAMVTVYLFTLWTDNGWLRARAYSLGLGTGLLALMANVILLEPAAFGIAGAVLYGLTALSSTFVLGLTSCGMLFGHWYLVDPGLPVDYLRTFVRLLGIALVAELVALVLAGGLLALLGGGAGAQAVRGLLDSHLMLLSFRFVLGPMATLVLAWMCWETLKLPQTMAATGLLYIAVMSALVGEMLGRFIMFRTAVPL